MQTPPDVDCYTLPNGDCIAWPCRLHGPRSAESEEVGPLPCTPAAALEVIESARRKVMDLYGGNLDQPALDHLAALCAAEDIERSRLLAPTEEP